MSSVDDRIVNMKFNSSQFTQGASEAQKSLNGLDQTIANAGKGGGGLTSMGNAVGGITTKFSALQVAGVAALGTIVSKATTAGIGLVKSLTIDPIMQGFSEYQTNLDSIQTVMSNTGAGVDEVNGYMQRLNEYSDQTIYNFSEMAKNIGTFTAAGVNLETATSSIQGIANLAALSGSSSSQAATAMYQLSQAIASGKVGLMDWNSVVNAGMGGKVFQTALAQTGVAMGQLSGDAVQLGEKVKIMGGSFRESIAGGNSWLTGDTLTQTLELLDGRLSKSKMLVEGRSKAWIKAEMANQREILKTKGYTDDQIRGMIKTADAAYNAATVVKSFPQLLGVVKESIGSVFANSFSIILGDFEQSKKLWSSVGKQIVGPSGFITKMGIAWTGLLRSFVDAGGRTKVLSGLGRIFRNLGKIMGALKGAFSDIFPPASGNALKNIAKGFNQFTRNLVISKDTVENLRSIFGGFFAVLHVGWTVVKLIAGAFGFLFGLLFQGSGKATGGILSMLAVVGDVLIAFDKWITSGQDVHRGLAILANRIGPQFGPVIGLIRQVVDAFSELAGGFDVSNVGASFEKIGQAFRGLDTSSLQKLGDVVNNALAKASGPIQAVGNAFQYAGKKLVEFTNNGSFLGGLVGKITSAASSIGSATANLGANIIAGIAAGITGSSFGEVKATIVELATSIVDWFKSTLGIASPAQAMVAPGGNVVDGIILGMSNAAGKIGEFISTLAGNIRDSFQQMFGGMDALDVSLLINQLFSGGLMLALTKYFFGESNSTSILDQLTETFTSFFSELGDTLKAFQAGIKAEALKDIAVAIALLVGSIIILSFIDPAKIAVSLGAIAIMMGLLVGTMTALTKLTKGGLQLAPLAGSLTLIAGAMVLMAVAIAILGNQDYETLAKGLGAIAIGLAIMVGAMFAFSKVEGSIEGMAGSIIVIASAMVILAIAIGMLGSMNLDTLGKGLGAMAIGLGIMVKGMQGLDKLKSSPEGLAASVLVLAGAMVVMAVAVGMLGGMSIEELAKGMGAMAIGMALMVGALIILTKFAPGALLVAEAMALLSVALLGMAVAVGLLGSMDGETLAKGFGAIALGLGLLIAAAFAAQLVAPGLLILSLVLGVLGSAMLSAGLGMLAFATGFALLGAVGAAGVAIIVLAFQAFLALLPSFAIQIAAAFVSFLETIAKAAPRVREAMGTIFKNLLGVITDAIPEIGNLMSTLVTTGIGVLKDSIPEWIDLGVTIISKFLQSVSDEIPGIVDSVAEMVDKFLTTMDTYLPDIISKGTDLVIKLIEGLGQAGAKIFVACAQTALAFLHAIDNAIVTYSDQFAAVGRSIAEHIAEGMTNNLGGLLQGAFNGAMKGLNVPSWAQGVMGLGKAKTDPFAAPRTAVNTALDLANSIAALDTATGKFDESIRSLSSAAYAAVTAAAAAGGLAAIASDDADALQAKADKLRAKADKIDKKKVSAKKKANHRANKAQGKADKAALAAALASDSADYQGTLADQAKERLQLQQTLADADLMGKGDALADRATSLTEQANELFAQAQANADQAKKLGKKDKVERDRLLAQSARDAELARQLADEAAGNARTALDYYGQALRAAQQATRDRITQIQQAIAQDIQARADEAAYKAADDQGKLEIMQRRLAESEAKRDAARVEAARLIAAAAAANEGGDTETANTLLDQAETQAQLAITAADQAQQQQDTIQQLLDTINGTGAGGSSGPALTPSRSVLEDAASAIDRYTESLAAASQAASSAQTTVQYVQNNYSPVALSTSEIYRQNKNLLAAQELKIGSGS